MRLIDADALMDDVMERYCKDCDKRKGIKSGKWRIVYEIGDAPCRACSVDDMKDELENAPTVEPKTMQWIPCSERLPEDDGEMYLVTDYCEQINRRRLHISYCYVNREGFWSDVPMGYKVIAWMPLPEPYREDGEADGDG